MLLSNKEKVFRLIVSGVGLFALTAQFFLSQEETTNMSQFIMHTIIFFSYMTILTNILVMLSLCMPVFLQRSRIGRFFMKASIQTAILVYITIVCVAYHILLAKVWDPEGLQKLVDILLHYIIPLCYLLFWFLFVQKGTMHYKQAFTWLIYPLLYLIYAMTRGAFTGIYPYYFLNLQTNETGKVITIILILFTAYILTGILFIFIYRKRNMKLTS